MSELKSYQPLTEEASEKLNFKKIRWILSNYWIWLAALLVFTNLTAYLFLRYTKPVYEATSEIRLEFESDPTEFGIGMLSEDKSVSMLSSEIELLRSRLFFRKLLDSLDLSISYYTQGRILMDEKYEFNPFTVDFRLQDGNILDRKIFIEFTDNESFTYYAEGETPAGPFKVGEWINDPRLDFQITVNSLEFDLSSEKFLFILNSSESLQRYLEANLNVNFLNLKANTLQISFQDHNANKARDIVNYINNIYIAYTQEEKSRANKNKIEWIDRQLEKISGELEGFESYFEDFTIENRTSDLDEDLKQTLVSINRLDSQQYETDRRIKAVSLLKGELDSSQLITPPLLLPADIKTAVIKLNDLLMQREQLGISYKETTFTIQEKDREINTARMALNEQLASYETALQQNMKILSDRRQNLERSFSSIPGKSTEFNKNQRFYKLYEEFYLSLMQSKAEFEIAVAGITPNFKILAPARISDSPVYPNKLTVHGAGGAGGFILCVLFIAFKYVSEDKINSVEEVEGLLPYPVIGTIPRARQKTGDNGLVSIEHPKSGVSESLRSARTNIQFMIPGEGSRVIAVTSSVAGEGKTFIASNLAAMMALSNKKVCLVDLDLRKPSVHGKFNATIDDVGVSTHLIQKFKLEECIRESGIENLSFIPAGPIPPNPSELLMNGNFERMIEQLREIYDLVVLDSPPIGLVTDGILAMNRADLSLLVVRYGYTRKRDVKAVMRNLKLNDVHLAVVFNSSENKSSYGYNYGYYSDKKSS